MPIRRRNSRSGSPTTNAGLPLNKTNNRVLRGAFGDPVDGWAGKIIVLFPTTADFRGKMVPGLRVRIPPPKQATETAKAKRQLSQLLPSHRRRHRRRPSTTISTTKLTFEKHQRRAAEFELHGRRRSVRRECRGKRHRCKA